MDRWARRLWWISLLSLVVVSIGVPLAGTAAGLPTHRVTHTVKRQVDRIADPVRQRVHQITPRPRDAVDGIPGTANQLTETIQDKVTTVAGGAGLDPVGGRRGTGGTDRSAQGSEAADPSTPAREAADEGDVAGGGNQVSPNPGTENHGTDGLCDGAPVCLGILFAPGSSRSGSATRQGGLALTGIDLALALACLAGLVGAGLALLATDARRGRGQRARAPGVTPVRVANAAP